MRAIKSNKTNTITNFQTVFKGNSKKHKFKTNQQNIFHKIFFKQIGNKVSMKIIDKLAKYFSLKC